MEDKIQKMESAWIKRQASEGAYGEKKKSSSFLKKLMEEEGVLKKGIILQTLLTPLWKEN